MKLSTEHWRNNTDMENRRTQTRACSTAISSTTNLTQSDTVMNSGLREGRRVIEDRPTFSYIIYTEFVPHREQCVTSRRTSRLILVTARITRYTKTDCVGKLQRLCVKGRQGVLLPPYSVRCTYSAREQNRTATCTNHSNLLRANLTPLKQVFI